MFDTTRTADQTRGKPHPQMLHEIFEELAVEPARTLMVGDTTHDLELARNAACSAGQSGLASRVRASSNSSISCCASK